MAYFADFETTTMKYSTTMSKVWLWGVKSDKPDAKLHYDRDLLSFFETLSENKMYEVYFHNLSFDANYIYKWLLDEMGYKFINMMDDKYANYKLKEKEYKWICDERGGIYSMWVNYKGKIFQFLDSWKILMASVANIGKSIGLEKLDLDYDAYSDFKSKEDIPAEAVEYLERDIDVVIEACSKAFKLYKKKMTRAGMAYNDFQTFYNEDSNNGRQFSVDFGGKVWNFREKRFDEVQLLTRKQWIHVNRSYSGGYTYWNQLYTNQKIDVPNGVSYDVNSLYPAMMMNNKIPYGKMHYSKPRGDHVCLITVLIKNASIKEDNYPPIIKKHGGKYTEAKYLKNVQYTEYTWWEEEFNFIKDKYEMDYYVVKKVYFKVKHVFTNWLGLKKKLKIEAKNAIERDFHKGIYNSCYGKFAQNIKMGARNIVEDGNYVKEIDGVKYLYSIETNEQVRKLAKNAIRYGDRGQFKHEPYFTELDSYKHIAVASYITSKARLTLWDAMYKNLDIWLYSDTDSCYFKEEPVGLDIHESRFGAWKPEHKFNTFKVLRAKAYILQATHEYKDGWKETNKMVKKISGMSDKGKEKVNFENFHLGSIIELGKKSVKNVKGGKLIYDTDFKLGEEVFN